MEPEQSRQHISTRIRNMLESGNLARNSSDNIIRYAEQETLRLKKINGKTSLRSNPHELKQMDYLKPVLQNCGDLNERYPKDNQK